VCCIGALYRSVVSEGGATETTSARTVYMMPFLYE
jgi:hypothetical protein